MKKILAVILGGFLVVVIFLLIVVSLLVFLTLGLSQNRAGMPEYRLAWESNSNRYSVLGDGMLVVLDANLELLNERRDIRKPAGGEITVSLSWSNNDSNLLLYASAFVDVGIWELQTDNIISLRDANFPVSWGAPGLVATGGIDHVIQVRDGATYKIATVFPSFTYSSEQYTDLVNALHWSDNGEYLASRYSSGNVRVWSIETNEIVFASEADARSIAWSVDTQIAIATNSGIEIWDILTGEKTDTIPASGSIIRWNSTLQYIAVAASNNIELWSLDELTRVGQYEIHSRRISDIQWGTDNTVLASIDISGTIKLLDTETGNILNSTKIE